MMQTNDNSLLDTIITFDPENNQNHANSFPDLEIIPVHHRKQESVIISTEEARMRAVLTEAESNYKTEFVDVDRVVTDEYSGSSHFLTDDENLNDSYEKKKSELLEYIIQGDGSAVCKLCGEILPSRTHWYRHKYRKHVNNPVTPTTLFKCTICNCFFKSRKGYTGHVMARHEQSVGNIERDELTIKEEIIDDSETLQIKTTPPKKKYKVERNNENFEEKRTKEEELVAAIIARVRKECEAQGSAVTRKGYSRRSTVMMNTT